MFKVLIPVDGSPHALDAVRRVLAQQRAPGTLDCHLLSVQPRLTRHAGRFLRHGESRRWAAARAEQAFAAPRAELARHGVAADTHWTQGDRASAICDWARRLGVHQIVLGTARLNPLARLLGDAALPRLLEDAPVPVEVVTGAPGSRWERWGLPAGVLGLGGGLLLLAID